MKLVIASDLHGAAPAVRALAARIEAEAPDRVLLLGDLLYHGPRNDLPEGYAPREVAAVLNGMAARITAVRGNCDWASPLPAVRLLHLEGTRVLMLHGDQHGVKGGLAGLQRLAAEQRADVVLYGHTHAASCTYLDGVYFLNPGSPTSPRAGRAGYAYLDLVPAGIVPVLVPLP